MSGDSYVFGHCLGDHKMKSRLVLAGIFLSLSAPVSAEDISSVEQIGDFHSAEMQQRKGRQAGASNRNETLRREQESANVLTVQQDGTGQTSKVEQDGPRGSQTAIIEQSGENNDIWLVQDEIDYGSNSAAIQQTGSRHATTAKQDGYEGSNALTVLQSGSGHQVHSDQVSSFGGSDAAVEQTGWANVAVIAQGGGLMGNRTLIQQAGSENEASVEQRTGEGLSDSLVSQDGTRNRAEVRQRMDTGYNVSQIVQSGAENTARVEQAGEYANTNESTIAIDGTGNDVEMLQGVSLSDGTVNHSHIRLSGADNTIALQQTGFVIGESNSEMQIDGDSNVVSVTQRAQIAARTPGTNSSMTEALLRLHHAGKQRGRSLLEQQRLCLVRHVLQERQEAVDHLGRRDAVDMGAHIGGRYHRAIIAPDRHGDRTEAQLGLLIDE